jgi:hypothetical protein
MRKKENRQCTCNVRNTKLRSRNRCYSGKAINIKYYERAVVLLP